MSTIDRSLLPEVEERDLLRDSLRGFLHAHWPTASAVEDAADMARVAGLWDGLVGQGLAGLGSTPEEGGVRELALAMEELGRAAAPAPLLGSAIVNLALAPFAKEAGAAARILDRLQSGRARIALAFGELDPDPQAAALCWQGSVLEGTLRFVDGAASATHLLLTTPDGFEWIDLTEPGATVSPSRALGAEGCAK